MKPSLLALKSTCLLYHCINDIPIFHTKLATWENEDKKQILTSSGVFSSETLSPSNKKRTEPFSMPCRAQYASNIFEKRVDFLILKNTSLWSCKKSLRPIYRHYHQITWATIFKLRWFSCLTSFAGTSDMLAGCGFLWSIEWIAKFWLSNFCNSDWHFFAAPYQILPAAKQDWNAPSIFAFFFTPDCRRWALCREKELDQDHLSHDQKDIYDVAISSTPGKTTH